MLSMVKGGFSFQIAHSVHLCICIISKSTLLPFPSLSKSVQFQILFIEYSDVNILYTHIVITDITIPRGSRSKEDLALQSVPGCISIYYCW